MVSPPSFGAQFAEVEVDVETGQVRVKKLVMAVDCGNAINPQTRPGPNRGRGDPGVGLRSLGRDGLRPAGEPGHATPGRLSHLPGRRNA